MATEESQPESLRRLINRGDLEGLLDWIRADCPLRTPKKQRGRSKSALEFAVETGFYSMVKLLLEETIWGEEEFENALHRALWDRRDDLVELLVRKGACIEGISFYSVFRTMNDALINQFLDLGLDPCADNAFARILEETKAKPLLRFFKEQRARFPGLEDQIAMALVSAVRSKNLRWSALLLWAGAGLHREVPYDLESDPNDDSSCRTTAFDELISIADPKFMEGLKIKPPTGTFGRMLNHASYQPAKPEFKSLLKTISPEELNSGSNGSCDALISLVDHHHWSLGPSYEQRADEEDENTLKSIDTLLKAGAKWMPSNEQIRSSRRALLSHSPKYIVRLVRMILYTDGATTIERVWELCRTPSVREKIKQSDERLWIEMCDLAAAAGVTGVTTRGRRKLKAANA